MSASKDHIKKIITRFYGLLPNFSDPHSLRALLYHSVAKDNSSNNLWSINLENFRLHLECLLASNKNIYSATQLVHSIPKSGFIITFDDGATDNFDFAAPQLIERKMPFTIFVIGKKLKNSSKNYMCKAMLRELSHNPLVTIGSHSFSHVRLDRCSSKELQYEICDSKSYIEDIIGKEISLFSYPFGAYNKLVKSHVKSAGYKLAFTSNFDVNTSSQDKFILNRNEIWNTDDLKFFKQKLNGDWDWLKYRKIL
jgi:peptidoglycan/xylan/chitin deacetylase (PgdA/CDA1 family)